MRLRLTVVGLGTNILQQMATLSEGTQRLLCTTFSSIVFGVMFFAWIQFRPYGTWGIIGMTGFVLLVAFLVFNSIWVCHSLNIVSRHFAFPEKLISEIKPQHLVENCSERTPTGNSASTNYDSFQVSDCEIYNISCAVSLSSSLSTWSNYSSDIEGEEVQSSFTHETLSLFENNNRASMTSSSIPVFNYSNNQSIVSNGSGSGSCSTSESFSSLSDSDSDCENDHEYEYLL